MIAKPQSLDVSVVIPVFDEERAVASLATEIRDALGGRAFEILFVDDASRDGTVAAIERVMYDIPEVRVLRHRVQCGQSAAVATGLHRARGEYIATLDGDGQNPPADLPKLIAALDHADLACGVRVTRRDSWVRRMSSRVANGFRNAITGVRMIDAGCGMRAMRRAAIAELPVFNGMHRFLPTLLHLQGARMVEVEVGHRPRTSGRSKYGVANRALRGLVDCVAMLWWRRRVVPRDRQLVEADRAPESAPVTNRERRESPTAADVEVHR